MGAQCNSPPACRRRRRAASGAVAAGDGPGSAYVLSTVARAQGPFGHRWGITVLAPPGDRPDSVMPGVSPTPGRSRRREARRGVVKQRVRPALDDPNVERGIILGCL